MKTIKLTILGLFISTTSFSQLIWNFEIPNPDNITDSIRYVISDDRIYEFNEESEILNQYQGEDFQINIDSNQVLALNFYDNCKLCEVDGTRFMIVFGRKGEVSKGYFNSKPNFFMIYGDIVRKVYVSKPIE
jgi:hypothetical protein